MLMLETTTACASDHQQVVLLHKIWLSSKAAWRCFHLSLFLAPAVGRAVLYGVQDSDVQLGSERARTGDF